MLKMMMTIKEFSTHVKEGIYSLRFAVILLTFIIFLFIIVQICEAIYSFVRLMQPNHESDKYSLTKVVTESPSNSRKTSLRKGRTSEEDVVQLSSISKETAERNYHKPIFAEKSLEVQKSSSTSTSRVPSNSSNYSEKQSEENSLKRKILTRKEQSASQLTITRNKGSNESLTPVVNSPSKENGTKVGYINDTFVTITPSFTAFTADRLMLILSSLLFTLAALSAFIQDLVVSAEKSTSYRGKRVCSRSASEFVQPRLKKRYVLNKNKWYTRTLSWSFRDPFRLFKNDRKFVIVKGIVRQAFEKWSNSSGGALVFNDLSPMDRTAGNTDANFDVLFAKYAHGDKESFDGFGGIVAHSGYPVEGIIHFDGSEYWSINGRTGLDLRYVALHEIGHALGLRHSNDPKAIMNPYYSDQLKEDFELGEDDILGIRKLYGIS